MYFHGLQYCIMARSLHWLAVFSLTVAFCHGKPLEDNRGTLRNCGDPATNLTFHWSPKILAPGDVVTLYLEADSVYDYNNGKFCLELWVKQSPQSIFRACEEMPCQEVNSVLPDTCPFKRGEHTSVDGYKIRWTPQAIIPATPDPYVVKFNLFNEAGQETLCTKGPLQIRAPDNRVMKQQQAIVREESSPTHWNQG